MLFKIFYFWKNKIKTGEKILYPIYIYYYPFEFGFFITHWHWTKEIIHLRFWHIGKVSLDFTLALEDEIPHFPNIFGNGGHLFWDAAFLTKGRDFGLF